MTATFFMARSSPSNILLAIYPPLDFHVATSHRYGSLREHVWQSATHTCTYMRSSDPWDQRLWQCVESSRPIGQWLSRPSWIAGKSDFWCAHVNFGHSFSNSERQWLEDHYWYIPWQPCNSTRSLYRKCRLNDGRMYSRRSEDGNELFWSVLSPPLEPFFISFSKARESESLADRLQW